MLPQTWSYFRLSVNDLEYLLPDYSELLQLQEEERFALLLLYLPTSSTERARLGFYNIDVSFIRGVLLHIPLSPPIHLFWMRGLRLSISLLASVPLRSSL